MAHQHISRRTFQKKKECLKQFEQVKDPKLEKNYQSLIKGVKKDLLALRNNTEEVLKNTELMRESLDSLT
ncbi:MAG: hypothetical protein WBZ50_00025 [Nitrososphaeraceae archaeon]